MDLPHGTVCSPLPNFLPYKLITGRPLDTLVTFETAGPDSNAHAPVRYGIRQVLDQEYQKNIIVRENAARQARFKAGNPNDDLEFSLSNKENKPNQVLEPVSGPKRDFFGRVVKESVMPLQETDGNADLDARRRKKNVNENKVWVSFHEGFSNAVRKSITVEELLRDL